MRLPFCKECGNQGERARLIDLGDGTFICRWKTGCEHRNLVARTRLARLAGNMDEVERLNEVACPNCGSTDPHWTQHFDPDTGEEVGRSFWRGDGESVSMPPAGQSWSSYFGFSRGRSLMVDPGALRRFFGGMFMADFENPPPGWVVADGQFVIDEDDE